MNPRKSTGTTLHLTDTEHEFLANLVLAYQISTCPHECEGVKLKDVPEHVQQQHTDAHALFRKLRCLSFADERSAEDIMLRMQDGFDDDNRPENDFEDEDDFDTDEEDDVEDDDDD